jgi:hypothetical protein
VPFYENMSSKNCTDMQAEGKSEAMDGMRVLGSAETQAELPAFAAAGTDMLMMAAAETMDYPTEASAAFTPMLSTSLPDEEPPPTLPAGKVGNLDWKLARMENSPTFPTNATSMEASEAKKDAHH